MWRILVSSAVFACGVEPTAEDRAMRALAEAYVANDCTTVLRDAPSFVSLRAGRMEEASYYWGRCLEKSEREQEAIAKLEPIAHAVPPGRRADDALYYLGRAHYALSDNRAAASVFDEFIAERSESHYLDNAYYYRVLVALRTGDCPLARSIFERMKPAVPASEYIARVEQRLADGGCPI